MGWIGPVDHPISQHSTVLDEGRVRGIGLITTQFRQFIEGGNRHLEPARLQLYILSFSKSWKADVSQFEKYPPMKFCHVSSWQNLQIHPIPTRVTSTRMRIRRIWYNCGHLAYWSLLYILTYSKTFNTILGILISLWGTSARRVKRVPGDLWLAWRDDQRWVIIRRNLCRFSSRLGWARLHLRCLDKSPGLLLHYLLLLPGEVASISVNTASDPGAG